LRDRSSPEPQHIKLKVSCASPEWTLYVTPITDNPVPLDWWSGKDESHLQGSQADTVATDRQPACAVWGRHCRIPV